MPIVKIPFVGGAYAGRSSNQNPQECVNFFLETDREGGKEPIALYGTPGCKPYLDVNLWVPGGVTPVPTPTPTPVPVTHFTVSSDGLTVMDNWTGLMWQYYEIHSGTILYPNQQVDHANNLVYAGYSNWRLPRIDELITIINYERQNPSTYTELDNFPALTGSVKFGSSTIVNTNFYYWADIGIGGVIAATTGTAVPPSTDYRRTRCVRTGPNWGSIASRAASNTTNTVVDSYTGLVWQKANDGTKRNIADALAYASGLSLDGYTAWRLPTVYELFGILDFTVNFQVDPMVCSVFTASSDQYWTATPYAGTTTPGSMYWAINFLTGTVQKRTYITTCYVRCVHDPA